MGYDASGIQYTEPNDSGYFEFEVMAPGDMAAPGCYYEIGEDGGDYFFTECFEYSDVPRSFASVMRPFPARFNIESNLEKSLFAIIRLEENVAGSLMPVGTAFVFGTRYEGKVQLYIVTNRHIIKGHSHLHAVFHRGGFVTSPTLGRYLRVDLDQVPDIWTFHRNDEVDLAIMPLQPILDRLRLAPYFNALDENLIPDEKFISTMDVVENVLFIGYPAGIYDSVTQLPLVRQGTTATPYWIDYEGRPSFLIDAPVFPGSSGSPVFISSRGRISRSGDISRTDDLRLLGIISHFKYEYVQDGEELVKELKDLGQVFKSPLILQAIEDRRLRLES